MVLLRACCSLGWIMGITFALTMAVITVSLTTLNLTLTLSQGLVAMPMKALGKVRISRSFLPKLTR